MVHKFSYTITQWLIASGSIEENDRELYEFAICGLCMSVAPICMVLCIGAAMHKAVEGLLLILPFVTIRKFSGGYHAPTPCICFFSSCSLLTFLLVIADAITNPVLSIGLLVFSVVSLIIHSPIDSPNRKLDCTEIKEYKKIAIQRIAIWCVIIISLGVTKAHLYAVYMILGLFLSALLQLPCIIKNEA